MFTPTNNQQVCGSKALITFAGVSLGPNQEVILEYATSSAGPFTPFTKTRSGTTAVARHGVDFYPWQVHAAVPGWSLTFAPFKRHSYVRANLSGYLLPTFDTGAPALPCIDAEVGGGASVLDAINTCASSQSPVVHLTAPLVPSPVEITGDITVTSLAEAAARGCVSKVNGNVSIVSDITAPSITQLGLTLPYLTTVAKVGGTKGNVSLSYYYPGTFDPMSPGVPTVVSQKLLSMPLTTVEGDLSVVCTKPDSSNPFPLDFGLPNLTSVGGQLSIDGYNHSLRGLPNLSASPQAVTITTHTEILGAPSLLPMLTTITGNLTVNYGFSIANLLPATTHVTGNVLLNRSIGGSTPNGNAWTPLANLTTIGGDLTVQSALSKSTGKFPSLTSVAGAVHFVDTMFTSLQFGAAPTPAGPSLTVGALDASGNQFMATAPPGQLWVATSGPISFTNNVCLPGAEVSTFAAAQTAHGWLGPFTNTGNGTMICP